MTTITTTPSTTRVANRTNGIASDTSLLVLADMARTFLLPDCSVLVTWRRASAHRGLTSNWKAKLPFRASTLSVRYYFQRLEAANHTRSHNEAPS